MSNWHINDTCIICGSKLATDGNKVWCTHDSDDVLDRLRQENEKINKQIVILRNYMREVFAIILNESKGTD